MPKLKDLVSTNGVAAFSTDDFLAVIKRTDIDPAKLVLVGGQAIEVWGVILNVESPTASSLTEDADWYGDSTDADWLLKEGLGGLFNVEIYRPGIQDNGPNTAFCYIQSKMDGRILIMDFLRCIVGVNSSDITKYAITVAIQDFKVNVLSPLLCLVSRFANLESIPSKRKGNGLAQAKWMTEIMKSYLIKLISVDKADEAKRICESIAEYAEYARFSNFCYVNYNISMLDSVTNEIVEKISSAIKNDNFRDKFWRNTISRINKKHVKWKSTV